LIAEILDDPYPDDCSGSAVFEFADESEGNGDVWDSAFALLGTEDFETL
jgi:hypothetical protein